MKSVFDDNEVLVSETAIKFGNTFISENEIMHLKDFADYCMSEQAPTGWFELLTERNTLFIKEYIKSNWQKEQYTPVKRDNYSN